MQRVMTIAGSDSSGGAGIEADLKTFTVLGVYGAAALTAVTAQNTLAVRAIQYMTPDIVQAQIEAVLDDIGVHAVKTGMLGEPAIVAVVADALERYRVPNLVVDPVMVSKSNARLLLPEAVACLKERLLPLATVVTPNVPELSQLTGVDITREEELKEAAVALWRETQVRYVLAKGGHLASGPATDWLYDGCDFRTFSGPRLATRHTHGTGCTFSAALAAFLARDMAVPDAVDRAKQVVSRAIAGSLAWGRGWGPVNPLAVLATGVHGDD